MSIDQNFENIQIENAKQSLKIRRLFQSVSIFYPILLSSIVVFGTIFLILIVTRQNTRRQLENNRIGSLSSLSLKDYMSTWAPCVKTSKSSLSCACPASFIRSSLNSTHCISSHSYCLQSCQTNLHCVCHNLIDKQRCHQITRQWIKNEFHIGLIKPIENDKNISFYSLSEKLNQQFLDVKSDEQLLFSSDRRTSFIFQKFNNEDFRLNKRWTKIAKNTTQQEIVYTLLDPQTNSCRLSLINKNETIKHGLIHKCPSSTNNPPFFFDVICKNIFVLWNDDKQFQIRQHENFGLIRHNFQSILPRLPILFDPFHRYYSLYDDFIIEIKDLDGDILGQIFTNVQNATKFQFIDPYGTILVANKTHMQFLSSINKEVWFDI